MRRQTPLLIAGTALAVSGLLTTVPGTASAKTNGATSLALFGDAPYGTTNSDTAEFKDIPAFIDQINADPDVTGVVHVGDIHSGKQFCTETYDRSVAQLFTRFQQSLVYTPGDNEWADFHKKAEGGGAYNAKTGEIDDVKNADGSFADYAKGNPVENLALVRSIFFPTPGQTLGQGHLRVESQATAYDPAHPEDAAYVENVRWSRKGVELVTLDVPGGSNNDADPWYGAPTASQQQTDEAAARTAADLRWLDAAFAQAKADDAHAVVVITQADMWDVDGKSPAHLTGYEPFVKSLADHTNALGKPVLLFNGDSHVYRSDNPFDAASPCETEGPGSSTVACSGSVASAHPGYSVPDSLFHRVTVHGSTFPLEWLKLTISPREDGAFGPFSWERHTTDLSS